MRRAEFKPQPTAHRGSELSRVVPLSEAPDIRTVVEIVRFLDVERSKRYQPTPTSTYCNIYAYDVCYLAGLYLPRVWWNMPDAVTAATEVVYNKTVHEMNANALYDWLVEFGEQFGWVRLANSTIAQERADSGEVVLIAAARTDRSTPGHIAVVHPQTAECKALSSVPVQSQAGKKNYCATTAVGRWWEASKFGGQFGFWSTAVQST